MPFIIINKNDQKLLITVLGSLVEKNNNLKKLNVVGPCLNSTDNIDITSKYKFIKGGKSYNKEDITVINLHVPNNITTDPSQTHTHTHTHTHACTLFWKCSENLRK